MNRALSADQCRIIESLAAMPRALVFADLGCGKTAAALHHLVRRGLFPALVISTRRVAELVWNAEAALWPETAGLRVSVCVGDHAARLAALHTPADLYTINIENAGWLLNYAPRRFGAIVLDELSLWKGGGRRWDDTRALLEHASHAVGLTGTPAPNGLLDLWAQADLVAPGVLGRSRSVYKARYFYAIDRHRLAPALGSHERIMGKLAPFVIRVENRGAGAPDLRINPVPVHLPPGAEEMQRAIVAEGEAITPTGATVSAEPPASRAVKAHQIANGRVYTDDGAIGWVHDAKQLACAELVADLQGEPVIIAYHFRHDLDTLRETFPDAAVIDDNAAGSTVDAWNRGDVPVLLLHPASAGHGLNLQKGGHHLIWYSLTWNLDHFTQMNARLARQGQPAAVVYAHVLLAGKVDRTILKALEGKRSVQQAVLDSFENNACVPE